MSDTIPRPLILGVQAFGALILLAAFTWYVEGWLDYNKSANWTEVQGTVVASAVRVDGKFRSASTKPNEKTEPPSYVPTVKYQYAVGGQQRQSEVILLNGAPVFNSMEEAKGYLTDYEVGGPVEVLVNPENPDQAVLEANPPDLVGYLVMAFCGLMFCGFGAALSKFRRMDSERTPTSR